MRLNLSSSQHYIHQEIENVFYYKPHVVILGAGASRAALPKGDFRGKKIPMMNDLIEVLGIDSILKKENIKFNKLNFEEVYSLIYNDENKKIICDKIGKIIYEYFSNLEYPYKPTIYDHLLLSLRETDLIASFNWDPFLMEAYRRNVRRFKLPRIVFLHGNVTVGYCVKDSTKGLNGHRCSKCKKLSVTPPEW